MSGLFPSSPGGQGGRALPSPASIQLEKRGLTPQLSFPGLPAEELWNRSIAAKLWECGRTDLSAPLEQCKTVETFCHCLNCHHVHKFWNRCDRFYCPICAPKLAYKRRLHIQWWVDQVKDPKHVVLTARNKASISKTYVRWFKANWARLRRSKFASDWTAGLYAYETTNEGRGWHFHMHAVLEAPWIDAAELARKWAKLVTQDFAIVHVSSLARKDYLQEVVKYTAKGSEIASWKPPDIADWIDALTGSRMFGTFGRLFKDQALRQKVLEELDTPPKPQCPDCKSQNLEYLAPDEVEYKQAIGSIP